jgi:anti-anti-sigma factor
MGVGRAAGRAEAGALRGPEGPEMLTDPTHGLLEVERVGEHTVGRFTRRTILESTAIDAVAARLRELARAQGRRTFVLNFARVESLPSAMLGKLVTLHRDLEDAGGRLVFCSVDAFLAHIFQICKIPEQIPVYRDEPEALQALSGPAG